MRSYSVTTQMKHLYLISALYLQNKFVFQHYITRWNLYFCQILFYTNMLVITTGSEFNSLTAVITNMRLQRVFFFGSNLWFGGRQSTVTMVFTHWPRKESFPVFLSTERKMLAFKPFLQYFATGSDTTSCQDYKEYEFVECLSEETQIVDLISTVSYNHIITFSIHARN